MAGKSNMSCLYNLYQYVFFLTAYPAVEWVYGVFDKADDFFIGYPVLPGGGSILTKGDRSGSEPSVTDLYRPFLCSGIKVLRRNVAAAGQQQYEGKEITEHRNKLKQKGFMCCMKPSI